MNICKWKKNGFHFEDHEYWETGCGNFHQRGNEGPKELNYRCPYCGGKIEVEVEK